MVPSIALPTRVQKSSCTSVCPYLYLDDTERPLSYNTEEEMVGNTIHGAGPTAMKNEYGEKNIVSIEFFKRVFGVKCSCEALCS